MKSILQRIKAWFRRKPVKPEPRDFFVEAGWTREKNPQQRRTASQRPWLDRERRTRWDGRI